MPTLSEAEVEAVLLGQLQALGYACLNDSVSGADGAAPERKACADTFLSGRLCAAIARLNPHTPQGCLRGCLAAGDRQ